MLSKAANKSFLLVKADWSVDKALELLVLFDELPLPHVVVEQTESKDCYYLFRNSEIIPLFKNASPAASINTVLHLSEREPVPVLAGYDDELEAPPIAVVVDDGYIIGVFDPYPEEDEEFSFGSVRFEGIGDFERLSNRGISPTVTKAVIMDIPPEVTLGEIALLTVRLSSNLMEGQAVAALDLNVEMDVRVEPIRSFEVIGIRQGGLPVQETSRAVELQFRLKATQLGLGIVKVYLSQQGQPIASIHLESQIVEGATSDTDSQAEPSTPVQVSLSPLKELTPDLSLTIIEETDSEGSWLHFELRTREEFSSIKVEQPFEPTKLEQKPEDYFRQFFRDFENRPLRGTKDYLQEQGSDLFLKLIPEKLRKLLWDARDRIASVQILSDDPWIPWELLVLQGWDNDHFQSGKFLSENFAVTRWMRELSVKPQVKLSNVAVIVADDAKLEDAAKEKSYLQSIANQERQVTPVLARRTEVLKAFSLGKYDALHFICHGSVDPTSPTKAVLTLDKGDSIEPSFLSFAACQNLGKAQPLVFVNACQSGHATSSLVGHGGWATQFLKAAYGEEHLDHGASAFIGTYWSTQSASAAEFAQHFYAKLLQDCTVGEAVKEARLAIRKDDDPTWLAYTVFAHPLARWTT